MGMRALSLLPALGERLLQTGTRHTRYFFFCHLSVLSSLSLAEQALVTFGYIISLLLNNLWVFCACDKTHLQPFPHGFCFQSAASTLPILWRKQTVSFSSGTAHKKVIITKINV